MTEEEEEKERCRPILFMYISKKCAYVVSPGVFLSFGDFLAVYILDMRIFDFQLVYFSGVFFAVYILAFFFW